MSEKKKLWERNELGVHISTWDSHHRSKNWLAQITGEDETYKFKRVFLNGKKVIDSKVYFEPSAFSGVRFLQVEHTYFTGGGKPEKREGRGLYEIELRKDGLYGENLTEAELILRLKDFGSVADEKTYVVVRGVRNEVFVFPTEKQAEGFVQECNKLGKECILGMEAKENDKNEKKSLHQ